MFCRRLFVGLVMVAVGFVLSPTTDGAILDRNTIPVTGGGNGTYFPIVGSYVGDGNLAPFGKSVGTGRVETSPTGPTTLSFQGFGRGTRNEVLDRFIVEGGTIFLRFDPGTVQLEPVLDDPNNPFDPAIGPFTATWTATNRVVGGTGRFKNARGAVKVTAINAPFLLTDEAWQFEWTWDGVIRTVRGLDR